MKNTIFSLILFFSVTCYGQKHSEFVIRGTIKNNSVKSVTIGDSLIQIKKEGTFLYKSVNKKLQSFTVKYQDRQFELFVEPGEHIEIFFDAKDIDNSIKFKGNSSETNLFLFKKCQIDEKVENYLDSNIDILYGKDEHIFIHALDSLKKLYLEPLDDLLRNNDNINQSLVFEIRNSVNFSLDKYIFYYLRQANKINGNKVKYNGKAKAYLKTINLDNPNLIDINGYDEFGEEYLIYFNVIKEFLTNKELKKSDNQLLQAYFNAIDYSFKNKIVKTYWRFKFLHKHIDDNGVKNIESFIESFNHTCLSEEYKNTINGLYQKGLGKREGHLIRTYKTIDGFELDAHIFIPDSLLKDEKRPAIVKFHGGGWAVGTPEWLLRASNLGFINVCIEYRTFTRYGTHPFEQISDTKSAIRWLREHADEFHIDKNKIIAEGFSAGGHIAMSAAMLDTLDEPNENKKISSVPDALILTGAAFDLTFYSLFEEFVTDKEKYKKRLKDISPNYNIKKQLPPMLVFHGEEDREVPYRFCETFVNKMKNDGNDIYLYPFEGLGHFIWWTSRYWQISAKAKKEFYKKLGYL